MAEGLILDDERAVDRFDAGELIAVQTTQPLDRTLDYRAPEGGCAPGDFLEVPLGPRAVLGVAWGPGAGDFDSAKVRTAARVLDAPPMREAMRTFLERAAEYTLTPMPAMLRLATRTPGLGGGAATRRVYRRGPGVPDRMTDARRRTLAALDEYGGAPVTMGELSAMAGVSSGVIKGLVAHDALLEEEAPRDTPYPRLDHTRAGIALNPDQQAAAEALRLALAEGGYGTTLLKGVTGRTFAASKSPTPGPQATPSTARGPSGTSRKSPGPQPPSGAR